MSLVPASKTAEYLALLRAIEFNRPPDQRLFSDPYARLFLPPLLALVEKLTRVPFLNRVAAWVIDRFWAGALTCCSARTRLVDVMTVNSIQNEGVNQVIIFGAGYDSRSLRLKSRRKVQYVEVDHPEMQTLKREKLLSKTATGLPHNDSSVNYVAVDVNTQPLEQVIPLMFNKAHYKTMFIWEGVTNSLNAPIAPKVFGYFSRFKPGTIVVFTYVDQQVLDHPERFKGASNVNRLLRHTKEHWNFGLEPDKLAGFLENYNMQLIHNADTNRIRDMYYGKEKADNMKGYEYYRVAMAVVK
jgi:methyltransferase (TIGR00027 family)